MISWYVIRYIKSSLLGSMLADKGIIRGGEGVVQAGEEVIRTGQDL